MGKQAKTKEGQTTTGSNVNIDARSTKCNDQCKVEVPEVAKEMQSHSGKREVGCIKETVNEGENLGGRIDNTFLQNVVEAV